MLMIKKFVFYSFENLYWYVSFFRERKKDGEDDIILDTETSENVLSASGKRSKHQMQRKKQFVLLNQKMKQPVHGLMMR